MTQGPLVPVYQWDDLGIFGRAPKKTPEIPPLVLKTPHIPEPPRPNTLQPGFGHVDPLPIRRHLIEDAYIDIGIGTPGTVDYGDSHIGPTGSRFETDRTR